MSRILGDSVLGDNTKHLKISKVRLQGTDNHSIGQEIKCLLVIHTATRSLAPNWLHSVMPWNLSYQWPLPPLSHIKSSSKSCFAFLQSQIWICPLFAPFTATATSIPWHHCPDLLVSLLTISGNFSLTCPTQAARYLLKLYVRPSHLPAETYFQVHLGKIWLNKIARGIPPCIWPQQLHIAPWSLLPAAGFPSFPKCSRLFCPPRALAHAVPSAWMFFLILHLAKTYLFFRFQLACHFSTEACLDTPV